MLLLGAVAKWVRRSLPQKEALDSDLYPGMSEALKKAVTESGIVASSVDEFPGLRSAYKLGYLQADYMREMVSIYDFPTHLHRRYELDTNLLPFFFT